MSSAIKQRPTVSLPATIHPILKRIYAERGVIGARELDYALEHLLHFGSLFNIDKASSLLAEAIKQQKHIAIVADFDTDGATGCAVAVRALRSMGAYQVSYITPNRLTDGYGLTPRTVEMVSRQSPDLLVTVDNGISSIAGVSLAREMGMDVLVTDHHLPGETLPDASVIVNPNQKGDMFPSKALSGVGVIFYVMLALRHRLREDGLFAGKSPNLSDLLDLVALGTVADVVPLDYNNRILVAQGLARIRDGRCNAGLAALLVVGGRDRAHITEQDLAYAVAPRLNAAGRLDNMSKGIACLLTDDAREAMKAAKILDRLNGERKHLQALAEADIKDLMEACVYNEEWHQGVTGLVASSLKERLKRPAIAFASDKNGMLKGSARSVKGVHIRDILATIDCQNPGLVHSFGGHAMAAGLAISTEDFTRFEDAFNAIMRDYHPTQDTHTDGDLSVDDIGLPLANIIRDGGPWGSNFPLPLFNGEFEVINSRMVGANHLKMRLRLPGNISEYDAIAFNINKNWQKEAKRARITYHLEVNHWRGESRLQLLVKTIIAV